MKLLGGRGAPQLTANLTNGTRRTHAAGHDRAGDLSLGDGDYVHDRKSKSRPVH